MREIYDQHFRIDSYQDTLYNFIFTSLICNASLTLCWYIVYSLLHAHISGSANSLCLYRLYNNIIKCKMYYIKVDKWIICIYLTSFICGQKMLSRYHCRRSSLASLNVNISAADLNMCGQTPSILEKHSFLV